MTGQHGTEQTLSFEREQKIEKTQAFILASHA
jgi:hypothetical protein